MFSKPGFAVILFTPRRCRITDGLIGKNRRVVATSYTKEMAEYIRDKMASEEEDEEFVYEVAETENYTRIPPTFPVFEPEFPLDDIPF